MSRLLPIAIKQRLRDLHRRVVFDGAIQRFVQNPRRAVDRPGDGLFDRLIYGWGNSAWSGDPPFLSACVSHALVSKGPILECGSGLTTLLVGLVAQSRGLPMWTLEHLPAWAERVHNALNRQRISAVRLCTKPLRDYGEFDWYSVPLDGMPERFHLIICDGPPAATRGGRYGLGAVMRGHMGEDCTILLDDAVRVDEQLVAAQWSRELGMDCALRGADRPYFVLTRPITSA